MPTIRDAIYTNSGMLCTYLVLGPPPHTHTHTIPDIREQLKSIERGVTQKEPRFINRAVRSLQSLRKKANDNVLRKLLMTYYPPSE